MYTCPNCKFTSENEMNYCSRCGSLMVHNEPAAPAQPTYTEVVRPVYVEQTVSPSAPAGKSNLAKRIVGMSLSIAGLVFAAFAIIFALLGLEEPEVGLFMTLYLSFFGLPCSIIGFVFSSSARKIGDTSKLSRVGFVLGLIGIILLGVALYISFVAIMSESYYY